MRIYEDIKRIGEFWKPEEPQNTYSGIITIVDGGSIELEIFGSWIRIGQDEEVIDRIYGFIEKGGYVTLEKCYVKNIKEVGGISHSFFSVNSAYIGHEFNENENPEFNKIKFSIEGLDDWVGISGISIKYDLKNISSEVKYSKIDDINIKLDNEMDLSIVFEHTFPSLPGNKEATIKQKIFFLLSSRDKKSFIEFVSIMSKINYFLCFALDSIVSINSVTGFSETITQNVLNKEILEKPVSIYYPSLPFIPKVFNKHPHYFLFGYRNISNEFEKIINNWINSFEDINEMFYLYFSSIAGAHKYYDGKFLALVQGLEMYHRRSHNMNYMNEKKFIELKKKLIDQIPKEHQEWMNGKLKYANEISLRNRIKDLLNRINYEVDNKKLINDIVNTRNFLTHYDKSLKKVAVKGKDLYKLFDKINIIYKLVLLKILGMSSDKEGLTKSKIIKRK